MDRHKQLAEWFRDRRSSLSRFLRVRLSVSAADIDDVAQEVFLRLLRYDRVDLVEHAQAYLFKVAANVTSEWATRSSRRRPHSAEWLVSLVDPADPQAEVDREAHEAVARQALASLPDRPREILRLLHHEMLTHDQIASRLGISSRIVKRDIIRSYAALRDTLSRQAGSDARTVSKGGKTGGKLGEYR